MCYYSNFAKCLPPYTSCGLGISPQIFSPFFSFLPGRCFPQVLPGHCFPQSFQASVFLKSFLANVLFTPSWSMFYSVLPGQCFLQSFQDSVFLCPFKPMSSSVLLGQCFTVHRINHLTSFDHTDICS